MQPAARSRLLSAFVHYSTAGQTCHLPTPGSRWNRAARDLQTRFLADFFFILHTGIKKSGKIGCGRKIEKEAVVEAGKMLFFGRT